jgi:hypothetical protein
MNKNTTETGSSIPKGNSVFPKNIYKSADAVCNYDITLRMTRTSSLLKSVILT